MKHRRLHTLFAPAAALAFAATFAACDKNDKKTTEQPGQSAAPASEPAAANPDPAKAAPAPAAAAVPSADTAALRAAYGFAARLPKDVEGFSANYRLHDLWEKLSGSKWSATLLSLPVVKQNPQLQVAVSQWQTAPQAQLAKNVLEAFLGTEVVVAEPAGFTDKFLPWVDLIGQFQAINFQRSLTTAMSGGRPPDSSKLFRDAAPELVPALAKCDLPPLFFAFKAVKSKAQIDGGLDMIVKQMAAQLPPGVELGQFKLADKYDFQSLTITGNKAIQPAQEAMLQAKLKELFGDEDKAKETVKAILAKRGELAWGWVDEYFILSLGTDHAHLRLAVADADSALSIPAVARRGTQFLAKNPMGIGYISAAMFAKIHRPVEFSKQFNALTDELQGLIKPDQITAMRADVKRLEGRAQGVFKSKSDALVAVNWWDGGIRSEGFGGVHPAAIESGKPLGYSSLLTPSTLVFLDSRANPEASKKFADFVEDAAGTAWGWYQKYGRGMVPPDEQAGAGMIEMMAIPIVKDLWNSIRQLGRGLGDESAFVLDLSGPMPQVPNLPPGFADGKVPRIAWVWELKDRAAVAEAWKGFDKIIKQLAAFIPQGAADKSMYEPQMKKDGDVELHFVPLPVPTGDLLPNITITKDRWILSTSPTFGREIAAKPVSPGTTALGAEGHVQLPALCDLGDAWVKLLGKNLGDIPSGGGASPALRLRMAADILRLARSLSAIEFRMFEEDGQARTSAFLKLEDLK